MKHINIKAEFPGCGKSYVLQQLYLKDNFKRKYYITPQNKQCVDVIDKLKANNCLNPNVQTYAHFVGNWRTIEIEDQTFYIMTNSASKRAPTKKQIDLFIDEYSSLSKTQIDLICNNFNIRNLFTAGDANQFEPIPYHNVIYENYNRITVAYDNVEVSPNAKILAEYHDDGSLPDLHIDKQYVLTKTKRTNDPALIALINAVKNADAETILSVINSKLWNEVKTDKDLHIAYTNKTVNAINNDYARQFTNKTYITKANDKQFGLMKGVICNEDQHTTYVDLKRNVFQAMFDEKKFDVSVDAALADWEERMFGYAYAVTSHKLQGITVDDQPIIVNLGDIINMMSAVSKDEFRTTKQKQDEIDELMKTFHKMLYVAVSRAKSYNQLHFVYNADDYDELIAAVNSFDPFEDDIIADAIKTTSDDFNYDELLNFIDTADYASYNAEIATDAINLSYKDFSAKHHLSRPTWSRLRLAVKQHEKNVSRNVAYKEAKRDTYSTAKAVASNENISDLYASISSLLPTACCLASRQTVNDRLFTLNIK